MVKAALCTMCLAFACVSRFGSETVLRLGQSYVCERLRTPVVSGSHAGNGMRACVPLVFSTVALLHEVVQLVPSRDVAGPCSWSGVEVDRTRDVPVSVRAHGEVGGSVREVGRGRPSV